MRSASPLSLTGGSMVHSPEADVVIIGSGGAGLAAALTAAEQGAHAVVLEGSRQVGGTFAYSAGLVWVANNHLMAGSGFSDSSEEALSHIRALSGGRHDEGVLQTFIENAPRIIRWLADVMHVPFELVVGYPDYYADRLGGKVSGRYLATPVFPASELLPPEWASRLAVSPHFAGLPASWAEIHEWGGLAAMASWDWEALAGRFSSDCRAFGSAIIGFMLAECLRRQVDIRLNCRATELLIEGGTVTGVKILDDSGTKSELRAKRGVLLATGGYDSNDALKKRWDTYSSTIGIGSPGVDGSGITMALEVGAGFEVLDGQITTPCYHIPGEEADDRPLFRSAVREPAFPGGIVVNAAGKRFADESFFRPLCQEMARFDVISQSYPNENAFFIFDEEWKQSYSLGPIGPGESPPWLVTADSPGELAAQLRIDGASLEATVRAYNTSADRGLDPEFHRGSTLYGRHNGDQRVQPNPCVRALKGRFYGVQLRLASSGTNSGLASNNCGQVLHVRGYPIPGLYAAGNVAANRAEGFWINSGSSNAKSLTFGHLAVKHMLDGAHKK
jgi:3-oxosteroid 1-dehydrogenase